MFFLYPYNFVWRSAQMVSESTLAGYITLAFFVIGRNKLGAVIIIL